MLILFGLSVTAGLLALSIPIVLDHFVTINLRTEADKFVKRNSWAQAEESVNGRYQCLGLGNPCESIGRFYRLDKHITREGFQSSLERAGWPLAVIGDCILTNVEFHVDSVCRATGIANGFNIHVNISASGETEFVTLTLTKLSR